MNKYLRQILIVLALAIVLIFSSLLFEKIDSITLVTLKKWIVILIPIIFMLLFVNQMKNRASLLEEYIRKITPNSIPESLEKIYFVLEIRGTTFEKKAFEYLIKLMNRRKYFLKPASKKANKMKSTKETVTELFLVKSKIENLRAKFIAVIGITAITVASLLYSQSLLVCIVPIVFFIVLEVKIRVLEFRVTNGFFGTNRLEALQLLQFITDKNNKDDFDGKNGKRKVFVDMLKTENSKVFTSENGVLR